jgi:hypothetical protein
VRDVVVHDSHGHTDKGLPIGCYGVLVYQSRNTTVSSSEIYHNGAGIEVSGGGRGDVVENNNIHDQDVIIHNTAEPRDDDFGGNGLAATSITDDPGPVFRDNTVVHNQGTSSDYGRDGGGFEIYNASNTTITGNRFADNDGVLETGTGRGGSCANNVFSANSAIGRSAPTSTVTSSTGLVLRCATNMTITDNTLSGLDKFAFVMETGTAFADSIDNLTITRNTVTQDGDDQIFYLSLPDSSKRPRIVIDDNRYRTAQGTFATVHGAPSSLTFSGWRSKTGYDTDSGTF